MRSKAVVENYRTTVYVHRECRTEHIVNRIVVFNNCFEINGICVIIKSYFTYNLCNRTESRDNLKFFIRCTFFAFDFCIEFIRNQLVSRGVNLVLLFKSVPTLRNLDNGFYYLTFAVTACFVTDVAALLFGKAFGSRKLCPKISPQKTVEGAIGGLTCTVIIALIAAILLQKYAGLHFDIITLVIWAILVSIVGQFGDLCMSVVKRVAGVKDFGNLLPGHGGILDRFDSHMFAVAFTLVFCATTRGFIL